MGAKRSPWFSLPRSEPSLQDKDHALSAAPAIQPKGALLLLQDKVLADNPPSLTTEPSKGLKKYAVGRANCLPSEIQTSVSPRTRRHPPPGTTLHG